MPIPTPCGRGARQWSIPSTLSRMLPSDLIRTPSILHELQAKLGSALAADDFNAAARISSARTNSARLLAAPSETPIALGWLSPTLNDSAVTIANHCL